MFAFLCRDTLLVGCSLGCSYVWFVVPSTVVIFLPAFTLAVGIGLFKVLKVLLFSGLCRLFSGSSFPPLVWWSGLVLEMGEFIGSALS